MNQNARPTHRRVVVMLIGLLLIGLAAVGYVALRRYSRSFSESNRYIQQWFTDPASHAALATKRVRCPGAPFILPSDGLVGLLWDDPAGPYSLFNPHTGIDIFGDGAPGTAPVYAAYDGYLTRLPEWFATVIIRHNDPLQPGRTIWTYYTHMGSRDGSRSYVAREFPPGTRERWVAQGTLLGYQGEYAGSGAPIGLHVHFSIVLSGPDGTFMNEARLGSTLDPSPYLGMPLNIASSPLRPVRCS